ncbi:YceI family protein [Kineosporia sp. NBRC 101731]|uniref:YceI family protein n=1 Tax=Kineosporia sp. NBRC 101731 TaxID=3032199 RepID=UPI0024A06697|nr:YceI family protein [Kineosporia sp. NBRC 101731]GLY32454.1 hypothetical protein Kisp02_58190 [Kineosporia sp. NBRC 101731]
MTTSSQVQLPTVGTYVLDTDRSAIRFSTRHMFGLQKVEGTFALVSGTVTIADPLTASSAQAVASTESFASGQDLRDQHVKAEKFLHAAEHPTISFTSTEVVETPAGWLLRGQLTVRAVTAPIEWTVTESTITAGSFTAVCTASVDRYAFGIDASKGMAGRHLKLELTATAVLPEAS